MWIGGSRFFIGVWRTAFTRWTGREGRPIPLSKRRMGATHRAPTTRNIPLAAPYGNRQHPLMTDYRRNRVAGATYFFTVNLADRRDDLLVRHIDILRDAVRTVRMGAPFHIDAWVVLPEHMHCLWTLPEGDTDFSRRWQAIKAEFSK